MANRQMNLSVTDDAIEAWHRFAAIHGVTLSALAEALGEEWDRPVAPDELTETHMRMVRRAREITSERRRRK